ncbi:MAG: M67 family metallopeptidase [Desulfobacula sp.]|nr:M67 family metallopeptidase [Desulfobacula sp.]
MRVPKNIYDQIILHAKKDLPNEACGYLAGKGGVVTKAYVIKNIDQSHEHFSFDPQEQFAVIKDMRKRNLVPIAVYHSHPATPARPSKEDIKLAYDPDISYLIISLAGNVPDIKSFKIKKDSQNDNQMNKEQTNNNQPKCNLHGKSQSNNHRVEKEEIDII